MVPSVPVTVTDVALVAVTVSVDELPTVIVDGFAEMATAGEAGPLTVTIAVADALPAGPDATAV